MYPSLVRKSFTPRCPIVWVALLVVVWCGMIAAQEPKQDRETKVRGDQAKMVKEGFWIYNDYRKGLERAKELGKPLLVVFRCIPCEACAQLDASVIEDNPKVRKMLAQFVPVRIVHTNGMDMHKFQFDYDQSWAAFVLDSDETIIGRYGTRSHQTESDDDVSLEGFLKSLEVALEVHRDIARLRPQLVAKTGPAAPVDRPEQFPRLKDKYGSSLDYEGKVVASCIHCHQVGESVFDWYRQKGKPFPIEAIFPYPNPKILGIIMDPKSARTVKTVVAGSAADRAGLKQGDGIISCESQPVIATADIQWVLHRIGSQPSVKIEVERAGATVPLSIALEEGWRERDDIAWRATTWEKRRTLTGGMRLEVLSEEERRVTAVSKDSVGLKIKHVGQFSPHDVAKRAGFKAGDIILKFGEWDQPMTESQLLVKLLKEADSGDVYSIDISRDQRKLSLELKIP